MSQLPVLSFISSCSWYPWVRSVRVVRLIRTGLDDEKESINPSFKADSGRSQLLECPKVDGNANCIVLLTMFEYLMFDEMKAKSGSSDEAERVQLHVGRSH